MIKENILVSHNQIIIRSIPFDLEKQTWTEKDIEDGVIWNKDYIVLDPLVDDSFGCWFFINKTDKVEISPDSIRAAVFPFEVLNYDDFSINTVAESIKLYRDLKVDEISEKEKGKYYPLNKIETINFEPGSYSLLYEVCLGKPEQDISEEEVYYRFTFVRDDNPIFKVLKEDEYGWNFETNLNLETKKLENVNSQ
ncbi:hypothetical protein ACM46_15615 [Chryseobacterium angstadtii]|uniref:Uncharacterized protein n=1 Tax=Chryseobacterium angstadtii TaxID=558151 RepID=A0A0J7I6L3_9FLAO|nr:competence protein ComJ [Chryseobacterium angstadtii]KMQ61446.1 hypothetical protein ACM46_15615 [Chryseobacterium angstadtii]